MVETLNTKVYLGEDGVVYTECNPNTEMCIEEATQITGLIRELNKNEEAPLLCDISNVIKMPQNCRNYFSGEEHSKVFTRVALIIRNPVSRIIGDFFMGLNKPIKPTMLFTNKDDAVKWLLQDK